MKVIDVSNSANPTLVGQFNDGGSAYDLQVIDDLAYVADGLDGLEILNVTDLTNPRQIGEFNDGGDIITLYVEEDIVYLGDQNGALKVVQIGNDVGSVPSWMILVVLVALVLLISVKKYKRKIYLES